ncbi:hypothetical protein LLE49_19505 [Alicyclobacillus tolerans]|uniref:hypothetical protein n=1 Tax=Alicyclobacillus tolerans TaxID=90970 RepID=UPI001F28EC4E|nr:hypothetical protein [Alicyclobacillus tolerans]MCF8566909.1 hypothetical protein [Alicyclobacillus tolerans]
MPVEIDAAAYEALVKAAVEVQKTAVEKFGHYQSSYGPFEAWAALAPSTIAQKLKAGSQGDDPLIGHSVHKRSIYPTSLRQSITMQVDKATLTAQVGTNDPLGEWHEYGYEEFNVHYPPRPFLRPALYQKEEWIRQTMKEAIGMGLITWLR